MKLFPTTITAFLLAGAIAAPATAQQAANTDLHLQPGLTAGQFEAFIADLGPTLRVRQLSDPLPLGRGGVDLSFEMASSPDDDLRFPRVAARFGVSDRVDVGAWGGINAASNYGLVGFETNVALVRQGPSWPVTLSIRPSIATLVGPSDLWAATASFDLSISRAFGRLAPYAGVASTASAAIERLDTVDLDPATVEANLSYAGLAYRWRMLSLAAELQKAETVSYGFRVGTRF